MPTIDATELPALPAPFWFIQFFKVLGFTLHAVPMNLWYAGAILAVAATGPVSIIVGSEPTVVTQRILAFGARPSARGGSPRRRPARSTTPSFRP